jgi:hypothetical protein
MKTPEQRAKDELRRAKLRKQTGSQPRSGTPELCVALQGLARDLSVGVHAETRKAFGGTIGLPEIAKSALANYDTQMSNTLSKGLAGMAEQHYLSKEVDGYSMRKSSDDGDDMDDASQPYSPELGPCPTCGCSCGGAFSDELTLAANSPNVLFKSADEYRRKAANTSDRTLREGYFALAAQCEKS